MCTQGLVHQDFQDEEIQALEQKIRLQCSKFQNKVMDASKDLENLRNVAINQNHRTGSLEKDYLLRRSYTLFQQVEQEQRDYIGDCPGISSKTDEIDQVEIADFLVDLKKIQKILNHLNLQVTDKINHIDCLKKQSQHLMNQVDVLESNYRDKIALANQENSRLMAIIVDLEKKQAQFDEILRIENDIDCMHSEEVDSGILLTERRLELIQKSYDKLSQELIRREEMISQRDSKIAELEDHIRESDLLNINLHDSNCSSNSMKSRGNAELEMASSSIQSTPCHTSEEGTVRKLIWLAGGLRNKLKKKKEKEKLLIQEKELVLNLADSMWSTWELLKQSWKELKTQNESLKRELDQQALRSAVQAPQSQQPSFPCQCIPPWNWKLESREHNNSGSYSSPGGVPLSPNLMNVSVNSNNNNLQENGPLVHPIAFINKSTVSTPQPFHAFNDHNNYKTSKTIIDPSILPNPEEGDIYDLREVSKLMEECQRKIKSFFVNKS